MQKGKYHFEVTTFKGNLARSFHPSAHSSEGNITVLGRDRRRPEMPVRQQLPFIILCLLFFTPRVAGLADNMRLCGENLVKMMKIVCNNCFNGGSSFDIAQQKRDGIVGALLTRRKKIEERSKRSRKGIVEECCIRSCSYTYMRSYCCA
uniref:Insulin-like domain-containing protein n=1 Tax=Trichuris muris TaxID=70415 RepID=A0A5S6Q4Y9_TRIMR